MHSANLLLEEPIRMASILVPSKPVISSWAVRNKIDILSLSYTQNAEDVRHARECLSKLGDLNQTQIFAKIENVEGMGHFDEILGEVSRGNLGIDLPPEKVILFQKAAVHRCNMAGKPAVVTRVVDSMTDNLQPTRAEATDVANAVLDEAESTNATDESILKVALDHGKTAGVIKPHDRVVVFQKVGDSSVVKIIELEN